MKLTGNLDQLTKTSGNKRDQIVELPAAEKNGAVKGSKPTGRPRLLQTEEKLVKVWLDAPESVKRRQDLLFAANRELEEIGKNAHLVKAFEREVKRLEKEYGVVGNRGEEHSKMFPCLVGLGKQERAEPPSR